MFWSWTNFYGGVYV